VTLISASSYSQSKSGSLCEIRVQDILLEAEQSAIDAQAWFETECGMGEVLFHHGQMVKARLGGTRGKTALLRLLTIGEGKYGIKCCSTIPAPPIVQNVGCLIELHQARQTDWKELCISAPPLSSILTLTSSGAGIRDDSRGIQRVILALIDGRRTLMQVLEESSFDPVEALRTVTQAVQLGLAQIAPQSASLFPLAPTDAMTGVLPDIAPLRPMRQIDAASTVADADPASSAHKPTLAGLGLEQSTSHPPGSRLAPAPIIDVAVDSAPPVGSFRLPDMGSLSGQYPADGSGPKADSQRQTIDRYQILLRIGRGSVGTVYLARLNSGNVGFSRLYAIKLLRSHLSVDTQAAKDFLAEARIAGNLHHANVVSVHDAGFHGKQPYLVMDYIEGCSFNQLLAGITNRLPYFILPIVIDTLAGLQAAHTLQDEMGVDLKLVHCDVAPENILVGVDGTCRLTDFGMARRANRLQGATIEGKAEYVAPEQITGHAFDHRADIFSMGVVLWSALTGQKLFEGQTTEEILTQVCNKRIVPPSTLRAQTSRALDEVVLCALARNPNDRFETAEAMLTALSHVGANHGGLANPKEIAAWVREAAGPELTQRRLAILDASRNNPTIPPPLADVSPAAAYAAPVIPEPVKAEPIKTEPLNPHQPDIINGAAARPSNAPSHVESAESSIFYGRNDYEPRRLQSIAVDVATVANEHRKPLKRRFQIQKSWVLVALLALVVAGVNLILMKMRQH
jgi:eukaryotic-like serine/threonine-protein kinase